MKIECKASGNADMYAEFNILELKGKWSVHVDINYNHIVRIRQFKFTMEN